jgi:hypothetical protein
VNVLKIDIEEIISIQALNENSLKGSETRDEAK